MTISNSYTLSVDIKKRMSNITPRFVQYDNAKLDFIIFDNGEQIDLSPFTSAQVAHMLPSGKVIVGSANIIDDIVHYDYMGNEMSEAGVVKTTLTLHASDSDKLSILPFNVEMVRDIVEDMAGQATEEYGVLQDLMADVSDLVGQATNAVTGADEATAGAQEATRLATEAKENADAMANRASESASNADQKATHALNQGNYAKTQGDYAKEQGDYAGSEAELTRIARENAEGATLNANSAAGNANNKANLAEQAANRANSESSNLETLKSDVVTATDNANIAREEMVSSVNQAISDSVAEKDSTSLVRQQTEQVRDATDSVRIQTETVRDETQAVKNATETVRLETITVRDNTEATRVLTEQERQKTIEATNNTISATGEAQRATQDANTARDEANLAKDQALSAATSATSAAEYANEQGGRAERAANDVEDILAEGSVQKVNGKTGIVELTSTDVGAASKTDFEDHALKIATEVEYGHIRLSDIPNPTKESIGLGNVANSEQATKVEFNNHTNDKTAHGIGDKTILKTIDKTTIVGSINEIHNDVENHTSRNDNPHGVTKSQLGLGNVENVQQASKQEFNQHTGDTVKHITAEERVVWNAKETPEGAQAKADKVNDNLVAHLAEDAPHQYGGRFEWRYNGATDSLDLVVFE